MGWGVKATATLQPPFKDVPFSGVFPSGSHTKGSTTQRDDGAGWHDRAGKPREAAGGLHSARTVLAAAGLRDSHEKGRQGWSCAPWMVYLSSKQQEASIALTSVPVGPHTMGCPREKEERARSGLSLLQPQLAGQVRAGSWSEGRVRKEELQAVPELLGWLQTIGVCPIAESLWHLGDMPQVPQNGRKASGISAHITGLLGQSLSSPTACHQTLAVMGIMPGVQAIPCICLPPHQPAALPKLAAISWLNRKP